MKFCKNCGKELKENEVCNCQTEAKIVSSNQSLISKIWNDAISLVKKPSTTVENYCSEENNNTQSYIYLALAIVSFGLVFVTVVNKAISELKNSLGGFGSMAKIEPDYMKIFMPFALMMLALLGGIILGSWLIINKYQKNEKYDLNKSITLSAISSVPMTIINVIICLLVMILGKSLIDKNGIGILFITLIFSLGVTSYYTLFISHLREVSGCTKDASFIVSVISIVIGIVVLYLITKNVSVDMLGESFKSISFMNGFGI